MSLHSARAAFSVFKMAQGVVWTCLRPSSCTRAAFVLCGQRKPKRMWTLSRWAGVRRSYIAALHCAVHPATQASESAISPAHMLGFTAILEIVTAATLGPVRRAGNAY